jgi:hypothetical protein
MSKTNQAFLEIVADNGLEQIVDFPTRKDNTLDLMLLSHPAYKLRCKPPPSIENSDHDIVLLDINFKECLVGFDWILSIYDGLFFPVDIE